MRPKHRRRADGANPTTSRVKSFAAQNGPSSTRTSGAVKSARMRSLFFAVNVRRRGLADNSGEV